METRNSKGCMYSIIRVLVLLIIFITLQSCNSTGNEMWAKKTKKPGVGKVVRMKRGWGTSTTCNTYSKDVYIKQTTYKRYYYWRKR